MECKHFQRFSMQDIHIPTKVEFRLKSRYLNIKRNVEVICVTDSNSQQI